MKERIFRYLQEAEKGVAAARILRDVLNVQSPKAHSSDAILAGFLGPDPRFVFTRGFWHLTSLSVEPIQFDSGKAVVLHLRGPIHPQTLRGLCGAIRWADGRLQEFAASASINILSRLRSEIEDRLLIVWSNRELRMWNVLLQSKGLDAWRGDTLYLRNLAAVVLKRVPSKLQPEDVAAELGVSPADEARPREVIQHLNACWLLLLERIPAEACRSLDSICEWVAGPGAAIDFGGFAFGPGFLRQLPGAPGVYIMKDREGTILYVGKSRNLKRRVSSYFTPRALIHPKIAKIHEHLHTIEIRRTDNEVEALLLEMRTIKELHPAINRQTEVHEQHADRHAGRNLLLFVVDSKQNSVKIYLFRDGIFAGRQSASLGRPPSKRLREKLKAIFFPPGGTGKRPGAPWKKEILSRWLTANQKRLNYLDVNELADFAAVQERLQHYLSDPDKLTRKVYYR